MTDLIWMVPVGASACLVAYHGTLWMQRRRP